MNAAAVDVAVVVAAVAIEAVDVARNVMFVRQKLVASDRHSVISFAVEPVVFGAVAVVVQLVEDTARDCLQCCWRFEPKKLHHSPEDSEHRLVVVAAAAAAAVVVVVVADTAVAAQMNQFADSNSMYNTDCS